MVGLDGLIGRFQHALDRLAEAVDLVVAAESTAIELRNRFAAMGTEDKARQLDAIGEGARALLDHLRASVEQGDRVVNLVVGAKGTTAAAEAKPAPFHWPGYPKGLPHQIGWSDLHHVCHGDPDDEERGGHLHGTGRPGKTEFPAHWDDQKIAMALTTVAGEGIDIQQRPNGMWYATGTFEGVTLTSVVRPDGSVAAGWPRSGPGVSRNPSRNRS